jgi:hypothetical protein
MHDLPDRGIEAGSETSLAGQHGRHVGRSQGLVVRAFQHVRPGGVTGDLPSHIWSDRLRQQRQRLPANAVVARLYRQQTQ